MGRLARPDGSGSRSAFIVTLLLVSLVTTGLLAWQAQYAVDSHRATAERVLRDYAALAGEEFIRRAAAKVGYEGYYTLLPVLLRQTAVLEENGPDWLKALADEGDDRLRRAAPLARRVFQADPLDPQPRFAGEPPHPEVLSFLESQLRKPPPEKAPFRVAHGVLGEEPSTFVFQEFERGSGGSILVGLEVELAALTDFLRAAFEQGPLLPRSLGEGKVTNDALFVALKDHGGRERFRSRGEYRPAFGADLPFGNGYGGVLEGARVQVSLDPASARELVIGGLPRSRLPVLLFLLLLTAGLLVTAILQLRRERALQRLRAEFIASVSHELRTPLAQIRMFAETLALERVRSDGERQRALEVILREVRRLTHLVENVLQFSRAERGRVKLVPERRPVSPWVREVLELFRPLAAGAGVRLSARLAEDAEASFDPDALSQVLLNLLDNAVKYGPRGQEIAVGVERGDGVVRLVVDDEGPGVPEPDRRRVFDRFYRLERDRKSAATGTGIGLAVVRDLVTEQGGRAFVEPGERGGSRFVVELPSIPEERRP